MRAAFGADRSNLVLACRKTNSSKGKRDAAEWSGLPETKRCWYARAVIEVKRFWNLSVDDAEMKGLDAMLSTCRQPFDHRPRLTDPQHD